MKFTPEQIDLLKAPLSRSDVKERKQGGRTLSYVEGWFVIEEANRIFGFDAWSRETVDIHCVTDAAREIGENKTPGFGVTYICRVRVTVTDGDTILVREGCGSGHGIDRDRGLAHESALKEAETDAMKRALMTFGNPFGLALYDKSQSNVVDEVEASRQLFINQCKAKIEELGGDHQKLLIWWASDEQRKARRDFDLSPAEVITLKNLITAKLPPRPA